VHLAAAVDQAPASAGGKAARRHCSDGGRAPAHCACISGRHRPAGLGRCFINGSVNCMNHCGGHNDIDEVSERSSIVRTPSLAPPTPYTGSIGLKGRSATSGEELLVMTCFGNRPGHCTLPQPPDCATVPRHVKQPLTPTFSVWRGYGGDPRPRREAGGAGSGACHSGWIRRARNFLVPKYSAR